MPTVPSYGGPQASPTSNAGATFAAPAEQNAAPQQLQQAGEAMQRAGGVASDIAVDMQQQVNQVRVDDALNQARQQMLKLTYDPQTGYKNLKGDNALTRPDGQSLSEEYGTQLKTGVSDISGKLGNDAQRRLFGMQSNDLMTQFQGNLEQHTAQEYKSYALSTQEGTQRIGVDTAKLHWNDPDQIKTALDSVQAAVYKMGDLKGDAASTTQANLKTMTSAVHQGVIEAALQSSNPTYAQQYLNQYKGQMTADDILKTTGLVNHDLDGRISMNAVQGAATKLASNIAPTDMDRLTNIVQGMESKGKDLDKNGNVLTSSAGAKGNMQVMDGTNTDPGYGVVPAKDNSLAERARVGRDYLAAMVKQYGNPAQAMAAYNGGPGTLDAAIAKAKAAGAPQSWLSFMPKETQSYVQTGMTKLGSGAGAPSFPIESQFVQSALDQLGPNPRIEQIKMTREQAIAQYAMLDKSRKEQGDQAVQQAQQALVQNGGSFASLDPQIKATVLRYAPDKYDNLQDYAGKISDPIRADNLPAYNQVVSHPEELAKMSDATFQSFIQQNFTQRTARAIVKERDDFMNGKTDVSSESINRTAVNRTLNANLDSLRIPTQATKGGTFGENEKERLGGIRQFVDNSIFDAQRQSGQKMTPDQINAHISNLFAKDVTFHNTLWYGGQGADTSQKLMAMQLADLPSGAADGLKKSLIASGNKAPTNNDILNLYRKLHAK